MKKIMYICTGNICRSAMAHGYMQHIVNNSNEKSFKCSYGFSAYLAIGGRGARKRSPDVQ